MVSVIVSLSHAKSAKSAKSYSLSCFTLALEKSQTSLRQECAESFPPPPLGPPLSQGRRGSLEE